MHDLQSQLFMPGIGHHHMFQRMGKRAMPYIMQQDSRFNRNFFLGSYFCFLVLQF